MIKYLTSLAEIWNLNFLFLHISDVTQFSVSMGSVRKLSHFLSLFTFSCEKVPFPISCVNVSSTKLRWFPWCISFCHGLHLWSMNECTSIQPSSFFASWRGFAEFCKNIQNVASVHLEPISTRFRCIPRRDGKRPLRPINKAWNIIFRGGLPSVLDPTALTSWLTYRMGEGNGGDPLVIITIIVRHSHEWVRVARRPPDCD